MRTLHAIAAACALALASHGSARADAMQVQLAHSGTAHEALFALALFGREALAVGAAGQIMRSTDAGASWNADAAIPAAPALLGAALHGERAIAVGQQGAIFLRTAKGAWNAVDSGTKERLLAVALDATGQRALAVGAFGTLLYSSDQGARWHSVAPVWSELSDQGDPHLYAAHIDAAGAITVAGEFGLILQSRDEGANWNIKHQGEASLFALDLRADGTGFSVGQNGVALKSVDGGENWTELATGTQANLFGVASNGKGLVIITGMHEVLSSTDDGTSWQGMDDMNAAGPWLSAVAIAPDSTEAIAVGHTARVLRLRR